jgi:dTDP-4-amino-4,6-dideoxygalactose transaminase
MVRIPFLRPNLAKLESFERHLREMENNRLYSNFGPLNTLLEERIKADYFRGGGAVTTVNNATSGLILAMSLTKRPGARYAVMPSFTFAATPLAAIWAGLVPYFVDVRTEDFCMSEESLRQALDELGEAVAVVVPYAAFGFPMDLSPYERALREKVPVVVDAAASFGAGREGVSFGAGFPGIIVFSFHATKAFGIGEGGLVYSGVPELIRRVREAANFGFSTDKISRVHGLNAKLPEFAAAIGLATLDQFPEKMRRRREVYAWYRAELESRGLLEMKWAMQRQAGEVAHQFFPLLCPPGISNLAVARSLAEEGIDVRTYFSPPCHRQPAFEDFPRSALDNTEMLAARALSLPLWEEMTREQVAAVVSRLEQMNG